MRAPSIGLSVKFCTVNRTIYFLLILLLALPVTAWCQDDFTPKDLKRLSLEELINIEVTSVSRRAEKLLETPSAIQVVTGEDISKFGATNIPEALYLAGNLQVVQKGAHSWGVSARGFNTDLSNKMLVMIDGRTVYTPLFSGVFWDRQDYLLDDINRMEVISGPGGTLWGANAVNGVVNITTKNAKDTQGLVMEGGVGNELKTLASARYGGKLSPKIYYRVYGKYGNRGGAIYEDSVDASDGWNIVQGGFRLDADVSSRTKFTFQGDVYNTKGDLATGGMSEINGNNFLARWTRNFSEKSEMRLQGYYDHTNLYLPTAPFIVNGTTLAPEGVFKDELTTYDVDFQHQLKVNSIHQFAWGLNYRFMHDEVTNSPALGFLPTTFDLGLFAGFAQDEISLLENLQLTVGSKLEHNPYVGFFLEPNSRLRWKVNDRQVVWGAVSRAVRTPSRIDRHLTQGTPPYFVLLVGNENFVSETVDAYELGTRRQFSERARASLSLFYNEYDNVRSTILNPTTVFPLNFENGLEATTYGFEFSLTYQVTDRWRLFTSYNLLREELKVKKDHTDFNNALNETADPGWQFSLRSSFDLPKGLNLNGAFRWVDELPINNAGVLNTVPSYAELDAQIAWHAMDHVDIIVAGRNLLHDSHVEYGNESPSRQAIQRSVYGKVVLRF